MKGGRRYVVASILAAAGFAALFAVLPSQGAGREVKMVGRRFRPAAAEIRAGGALTFVNDSSETHTATCVECPQDTRDVQPGLLRTLTFKTPGNYQLVCRYHADRGMTMQVRVRA